MEPEDLVIRAAEAVWAAEQAARDWGCLTVEVTSRRARVGAHAFYQRMGYADVCDRSGRFLKTLAARR